MNKRPIRLIAAVVADGTGLHVSPGAVLIEDDRIVASGAVTAIGPVADAIDLDLGNHTILPALVNSHAHLDLTHIGPLPYGGDFTAWLDRVLDERRAIGPDSIGSSVMQGAQLARDGGTAFVADIAGVWSLQPLHALRRSGLKGVSYLEVFGHGARQGPAIQAMRQVVEDVVRDQAGVRLGISPHAPYTCGLDVYAAAVQLGLPLATHLAESLEELQFINSGDGAFATLLKKLDVWDESIVGMAKHPVDLLAECLGDAPSLAAHLNYVDDRCIERMAGMPMSVAYCPRASAYFGHPHGEHPPHRYRDMLDAGINVALGTDSILCLDTPDRISILDEMRFLYRRDDVDPAILLRMATINGAIALGVEPELVTLSPGPCEGLIAAKGASLAEVMSNDAPAVWVFRDGQVLDVPSFNAMKQETA